MCSYDGKSILLIQTKLIDDVLCDILNVEIENAMKLNFQLIHDVLSNTITLGIGILITYSSERDNFFLRQAKLRKDFKSGKNMEAVLINIIDLKIDSATTFFLIVSIMQF